MRTHLVEGPYSARRVGGSLCILLAGKVPLRAHIGSFTLAPPNTFPWEIVGLQAGVASIVIDVENP